MQTISPSRSVSGSSGTPALTQRQLAAVLGCTPLTIRRAIAAGKPVGGYTLITVNKRVKFLPPHALEAVSGP